MTKTPPLSDAPPPAPRAGGRRAEIVEIAARLFDQHGYHSTSMDDIAEAVGLRKPSLYHYFKSKDQILYEIHNEMIDVIISRHEARIQEGLESYSAELRALMGDIIELMETHPGHLRIFFEHHRELPDRYKGTIRAKRNRFRTQVSSTIEAGIAAGEFLDVDVELATLAVLGMANWTYQWLHPGAPRSAEDVTEFFWRIAMRGIAVAPPAAD